MLIVSGAGVVPLDEETCSHCPPEVVTALALKLLPAGVLRTVRPAGDGLADPICQMKVRVAGRAVNFAGCEVTFTDTGSETRPPPDRMWTVPL